MLPWTYESVAWSGDRANIGELGFLRAFNPPYFLFLTLLSSYRRAADWFSKLRLGLKVRKNTIIRRWNSRVQRKQPRDRESVEGKCRTRKSLPVLRASVQRHVNFSLHRIPPCIFIIDFASTVGTRVKERRTDNRERDDAARHADRCAGALTSDSVAELSSVDGAMEKHELLLFRVRHSIDKPVGLNQNEQAKQSLQSPVSRLARGFVSANVSSLKRLRFQTIRSIYTNDRLWIRMGFHSFH